MKNKSKPSTAKCNAEIYSSYLMSEPNNASCLRLSEIMPEISHDSVNRFLNRERFNGRDLFNENKSELDLVGGVLSVDDSVLDKLYSNPEHAALIDYYWSGKHHRAVKGINLVTLFYTDVNGVCLPVNYRIYDKSLDKTKNDYFRELLTEVISWGLKPRTVTGDSWYSGLMNLKHVRKSGLNFLFGVEKDRLISLEKGNYIKVSEMTEYPENGKIVYLKEYGNVRVFRQLFKEAYRYYIMGVANLESLDSINYTDFKSTHDQHWQIECYHRALKQVCNIERFQVRKSHAIRTHIYCALKAFCKLEIMKTKQIITNWYQVQRQLFNKIIAEFIKHNDITGITYAQL
jgi:hypothetical protein